MNDMHAIDTSAFMPLMGNGLVSAYLGEEPELRYIAIDALRIEESYQRDLLRSAISNIVNIAHNFNWSKFGSVIVAPIDDGLYAIVDGQCRTIAAACRGVEKVPCIIIKADLEQRAEAFAAINANVTKITALAIYNAQLVAKDMRALEIADVCKEAGVTIRKYPVSPNLMVFGETIAIESIKDCYKTYGRALS